jgi:hypothetical protein
MIVLSLVSVGAFYLTLGFVILWVLVNLSVVAVIVADKKRIPRYSVEKAQKVYEKIAHWKFEWQKHLLLIGFFVVTYIVFGRNLVGDSLYLGFVIFAVGYILFDVLLILERSIKQHLVRRRAVELGLQPPM